MAKIRKIYDETIKPDGSKQVIYPISSTRAIYTPSNVTIDTLLNEGYRFGGVVLPTDTPPITDQRVFYGAKTSGIYTAFGNLVVNDGEIAFLIYDGSTWSKEALALNVSEEIFIANYGETSFADMLAAYNAGKIVYCKILKQDYPSGWPDGTSEFTLLPAGNIYSDYNIAYFRLTWLGLNTIKEAVITYTGGWATPSIRIITPYTKPQNGIPKTDLASGVQTSLNNADSAIQDITEIEALIPAQASDQNQLADKNFVNSSIQTDTATFRGSYATWGSVPTDEEELPGEKAYNNDYMVVKNASGYAEIWYENKPCAYGDVVSDPAWLDLYICKNEEWTPEEPLISETAPSDDSTNWELVATNPAYAGTWRFKYVSSGSTYDKFNWQPEYQVNETPLTAAQLAALNSGITEAKVQKLNGIASGAEVNEIESVKLNGTPLTIVNKSVDVSVPTALSQLSQDATHRVVSDTDKATWGAKYDKPAGGIPETDLKSSVQASLGKADSSIQGVKVNNTSLAPDEYNVVDVSVPTALSQLSDDTTHRVVTDTEKTTWGSKQDALVSGTNIKSINGQSIVGSGDLTVTASSNLFIVEYDGSTTLAQIAAAISAGKMVVCHYTESLSPYLPDSEGDLGVAVSTEMCLPLTAKGTGVYVFQRVILGTDGNDDDKLLRIRAVFDTGTWSTTVTKLLDL